MKKLLFLLVFLVACGQGPQGIPGAPGAPGVPEGCSVSTVASSSIAPNGGALVQCDNGTQALILNGTNGSNGTNGTPGTVVAPVQFCQGTTTYPSKFLEVGFCIGNQLYAVYSENDGFLSLIPPGSYSSNAVGSRCNFQVLPNCGIQD